MSKEQSFCYTYSAERQEEIQKIRQKYLPPEEDKMTRLRKLHRSASSRAQAWSIAVGVIGTLMLGLGMSLCMTELGTANLTMELALTLGILTGVAGMLLAALAYPVYHRVLKRERARIAPEILRLTEELLQ